MQQAKFEKIKRDENTEKKSQVHLYKEKAQATKRLLHMNHS